MIADACELQRRALARDLHDTVIQPLTSLVVSFNRLEREPLETGRLEVDLGLWKGLAQEALNALRSSLAGLHAAPQTACESTLVEAIQHSIQPQFASRGMRLTVEQHDWPDELPPHWNSHLFLAVREALTNVEKHASASSVSVLLERHAAGLSIIVIDDGVGCHSSALESGHHAGSGSGFGIRSIRDRVRMLGGRVNIVTAPNRGMRLELLLPHPHSVDTRGDLALVSASDALWHTVSRTG